MIFLITAILEEWSILRAGEANIDDISVSDEDEVEGAEGGDTQTTR